MDVRLTVFVDVGFSIRVLYEIMSNEGGLFASRAYNVSSDKYRRCNLDERFVYWVASYFRPGRNIGLIAWMIWRLVVEHRRIILQWPSCGVVLDRLRTRPAITNAFLATIRVKREYNVFEISQAVVSITTMPRFLFLQEVHVLSVVQRVWSVLAGLFCRWSERDGPGWSFCLVLLDSKQGCRSAKFPLGCIFWSSFPVMMIRICPC